MKQRPPLNYLKTGWFVFVLFLLLYTSQAFAYQISREIPADINPGQPFQITITLDSKEPVAIGIVEQLPSGWHLAVPEEIKKIGGQIDNEKNRLSLVFLEAGSLSYTVIADDTADSDFSGIYINLLERSKDDDIAQKRFLPVGSSSLNRTLLPIEGKRIKPIGKKSLPGDSDGNEILTESECREFINSYLLGAEKQSLDDVCDAAWIRTHWQGRPKNIVDMADRQITLYRPVERIITTNPDNSMIVIAFGLGDMLVGTDECTIGSCICPRLGNRKGDTKASPTCWQEVCSGKLDIIPQTSTRKTVNHEFMTSLLPDIIFETTFWGSRADDMGMKVGSEVIVAGADFTVDSWFRQIRLTGQVLDKEQEAERLVQLCKDKINMITSVTSKIPEQKKPRVYFAPRGARKGFHDPKEGRDFTRTYQVYAPLELAGGINVASGVTGVEVNVSIEQIIAWNPDFIFVACSSPADKGVEFLKDAPELSSIIAIMKSQIFNVMYPHCRGRPIPRNIVNIMMMAKLLHPELFSDLDLEREGNEIYRAFLGVDNGFTEYAEYLQFPLEFFTHELK